jgi:dipeptide/tripeptide permease
VADKLPHGAFLVAIVELCERFAYYGLAGPLQNYMANGAHDANGLPGALGLGQSRATALSNAFQAWCYVTPILGAVVADQYLGRYATIRWFSLVYMLGIVVLFATSLPWSVQHGMAGPGLVVAMAVIGLGTGGIKSNVSPLIAEQVRSEAAFVETRKGGKRVLVDPEMTVQRIYMIYYMWYAWPCSSVCWQRFVLTDLSTVSTWAPSPPSLPPCSSCTSASGAPTSSRSSCSASAMQSLSAASTATSSNHPKAA